MKTITFIHLSTCPYCANARKAMAELKEEHPEYNKIPMVSIEESEESDKIVPFADDYYYVPSFFVDGKKMYEASPDDTYEIIRDHVKEIFEAAVK